MFQFLKPFIRLRFLVNSLESATTKEQRKIQFPVVCISLLWYLDI